MLKNQKIEILNECIKPPRIARVFFEFDPVYYYYYPNAVNEKFFVGQEENDFQLDGYHIRRITHIKKAEIKNDLCNEINCQNGVTDEIKDPGIDISSWDSIFRSLLSYNGFIIIENEFDEAYYIGKISRVCRSHILFDWFDADGIWQEEPVLMPFSSVTHVAWNTRYTNNWYNFLNR